MPYIEVGSKKIEVDEDGFLKDPNDWNEDVAKALAEDSRFGTPIELTDKHWELIRFVREFYEKENIDPPIHMLEHKVREVYGEEKADLTFINKIFPDGRVKGLARLAGLPELTGVR